MKHLLLTTIAAVLVVGCSTTQQPEPPTAKAPAISIWDAATSGNIEAVKQHIAAGTDVNARRAIGDTPLDGAIQRKRTETIDLLRKHGGKTGDELKVEGK
jgi:predicted component of type VI protein secretion system